MRESPPSPVKKDVATLIALFGLLLAALGLLALMFLVSPIFLGIIAVIVGFVMIGVFHYVAWGWWLGGAAPSEQDDTDIEL